MGKGNRAREMRAQDRLDNPKAYQSKKQTPQWVLPLVLILIAAIVVASLVFSVLDNQGVFDRAAAAMTSDNFKISGTMMTYFFRNEYISFVNQYSNIISYLGLDTSASLRSQDCAMMGEGSTWFDYFMDSATAYAKQLLVYCEAGKDRGLTLGDEGAEYIDNTIATLEATATQAGYSLRGYISAMYGSGVNENDIRACLELVYLADKCASEVGDELRGQITDADIDTYYNEHKNEFLKADYAYNVYSATKATYDEDDFDTAEELTAATNNAEAMYKQDLADSKEKADKMKAITDATKFVTELTAYYKEAYAGLYDDAQEAAEALENKLEDLIVEGHAYADPADENSTELDKWLFDSARKVGDVYVIESDSNDGNTHSIYVYSVQKTTYRDEYKTRNATLAIYDATAADSKAKAEGLKNQFTSGEKTSEAFLDLAKANGAAYYNKQTNLHKGALGIDEVDEFLFGTKSLSGTCDLIETDEYVVVVFNESEGDVAWYAAAKESILAEKASDWFTAKSDAYEIKQNDGAIAKIAG